jgi:hypothetical protein
MGTMKIARMMMAMGNGRNLGLLPLMVVIDGGNK